MFEPRLPFGEFKAESPSRDAPIKYRNAAGEGTNDRVYSSVNHTLCAGLEVEVLGTVDINATTAINRTGNVIGDLAARRASSWRS